VDTEDTVAVKPELTVPAGTLTDAGTVTALLLLERVTANPPGAAAAFRVTVQLSVPEPVMEAVVQLKLLRTGTPVPLSAITDDVPLEELLVSVICPDDEPETVGLN
jgi:hypothetical protein